MMIHILKQFFGGNEYENAEKLIKVAFSEGKLSREDVLHINSEIDGIEVPESDLRLNRDKMRKIKSTLPKKDSLKFAIMYLLIRKFNQKRGLDEQKRKILAAIFSVIHHEKSRIDELIDSVISNITLGNSERETFRRLEYLLKPRQVSFN